jgi:hypothetical protein
MLHSFDVARSTAASNSPASQMVRIDVESSNLVSVNGTSMVRIAARPTGVNTCHLVDLGMLTPSGPAIGVQGMAVPLREHGTSHPTRHCAR